MAEHGTARPSDVYVIDPATLKVINRFPVGRHAQHVVPSYDLKTLWVTSVGARRVPGSLTPIDPRTGRHGVPVPVLDPGRGRTKTGYFWSMARDDRPFGGTDPPAVAYTYAPGRGAVHLHTLLRDYRGIVQCDGYAPYKQLPDDAITLAFCWAHVRRGFFEIARKGNAPIATQALMRIAALYRIEETIRGKSAEQRRAVRREQSAPHCDALKRFLERQLGRVSAKAPIAQAIRYTLKHWQGLTRFLDDGRIDLDSNIVERSMRPQVLTRKNALFAGHDDGAQNWAIVASLIETSKLSGIDPYRYLADVLFHLVNLWPNGRLDELLPWNWAAAKDHLQRAA